MFTKQTKKSLMAKFSQIDINDIQDAELRQKAKALKSKQRGFTLLELLVVVAILAAIAGTATIALQDTDARASAAAHVAMMDELNKGIRTYRVLKKNQLPTGFDSLITTTSNDTTFAGAAILDHEGDDAVFGVEIENNVPLVMVPLTNDISENMAGAGITSLQYIHLAAASNPDGAGDCSNLNDLIASRGNAVVPGNIFMAPGANGCGYTWTNEDGDDTTDGWQVNGSPQALFWTGGYERVMGADGRQFDTAVADGASVGNIDVAAGTGAPYAPVLMAVGLGPSSSLFNANDLGGMTTVPVYRHVSATQYNRFIALFNVARINAAGNAIVIDAPVTLTAIIDGAGDTKEEELGEWDGTRSTI